MLTSQQNVPRIGFMQIYAVIIEKSICLYISTNIANNWQNKMYRPCYEGHDICLIDYPNTEQLPAH